MTMNELLSRLGVSTVQQAMLRFGSQGCGNLGEFMEALGRGSLEVTFEDPDPPSNYLLRAYILMVLHERGINDRGMSLDEVRKRLGESLG